MASSNQQGIDAHDAHQDNNSVTHNAGALGQQFNFVAEYIDQNDNVQNENSADGPTGGSINASDVAADAANGLQIVSIFETNGMANSPYELHSNSDAKIISYLNSHGSADAEEAVASAQALHQPAGSTIYFAIDFDPGSPGQHDVVAGAKDAIENYIQAVASDPIFQASGYKIGVYGAGQTLKYATTDDPSNNYTAASSVSDTWLSGSTLWGGYNIDANDADGTHGWTMIQSIPGDGNSDSSTVDGVSVDYDTAANNDFGGWDVACYCRGTMILTDRGEVAVEDLALDDGVVTRARGVQPIKWIGRRAYSGAFASNNRDIQPIVVRAGALDEGVPARDLHVSPGHALFIDEVLVTADLLANGLTITRAELATSVEYFHIEFEEHEVIVADGAPAESYAECDNRNAFQNARDYAALYPAEGRAPFGYCAPRLESGTAKLGAIRQRLFERAAALGHSTTDDPGLGLFVDGKIERPVSAEGNRYMFQVDDSRADIRLVSRRAVPAELERLSTDRRTLGACIERIVLRDDHLRIEVSHTHPLLCDGFHEAEAGGRRWTDGSGVLPAALLQPFSGPLTIEVHRLPAQLRYPLQPPEGPASRDVPSLTKPHGKAA